MIKAYMQVDLQNPLAIKYMEHGLESFECVSDILDIEVVQCLKPDTLLPELSHVKTWTPENSSYTVSEIASFHSNYRMMKRLSEGEKFFVMEHDAYLVHEDNLRKYLAKWQNLAVAVLGLATEFWTVWPEVAQEYCNIVESGSPVGNMSTLHRAGNIWARKTKNKVNNVYWPCNRRKDSRWIGMMGIANTPDHAYDEPWGIEQSPVTQLIDPKLGSSIQDRTNKYKIKKDIDIAKHQPAMHIIDITE